MNRSLWNKYRRLINFHTVLCLLGKTQFLLLWLPEQPLPTPGLASFGCEEVWTDTGINNVYLSPNLKLCRVPSNKFCGSYRIQAGRWAWVHNNPRHCGCIFYLLQLSRTRVLAARRHILQHPSKLQSRRGHNIPPLLVPLRPCLWITLLCFFISMKLLHANLCSSINIQLIAVINSPQHLLC